MKNILKLGLLVALFFTFNASFAQSKTKIGHINSADLLAAMPQRDSAQKVLEAYSKSLEKTLIEMQSEVESKYQKYMADQKTMNEIVKQSKEKEIQEMQKRLEDFQKSAQEDVSKKEQELVAPILDKAKKAIEDVAKENGYTYILDTSAGLVLYFDKGDDIIALVKKKLGIVK
ncbi:MAG: OmpH family outer membrane protein [Bacteroidota bacterium]